MARKSHTKRKHSGTMGGSSRGLKASRAFAKALKSAERACRGKKASSKKCKTAMGRVYATKRKLTKYVGTM